MFVSTAAKRSRNTKIMEGADMGSTLCPSCKGAGSYSIGDCEDGVDEMCPECEGAGEMFDE